MADREGSSKVEKMKKQYRPRQVKPRAPAPYTQGASTSTNEVSLNGGEKKLTGE